MRTFCLTCQTSHSGNPQGIKDPFDSEVNTLSIKNYFLLIIMSMHQLNSAIDLHTLFLQRVPSNEVQEGIY